MKISRNKLVLLCFVITFVILLITGTFFEPFKTKALLIAAYFAGWVALLVFCVCTFFLPTIKAAGGMSTMFSTQKRSQETSESFPPTEEIPIQSPRSDLPVRERITAYVAQRRREEGIPAPVPLHPNKVEEKEIIFPEKSFSPASVAATTFSVTSSLNGTKTSSEFDEHQNLDTTNADNLFRPDDHDFFEDVLDLDESSDEEFLEYAVSIENEEVFLLDDDFEDIEEIIDIETNEMSRKGF